MKISRLLQYSRTQVIPPRIFLTASDFLATADWYKKVLGFVPCPQKSGLDKTSPIRLLPLTGSLQDVCLVNVAFPPASKVDRKSVIAPISLLVNDRLENVHDRIVRSSASEVRIEQMADGGTTLLIRDPNGYLFRIASLDESLPGQCTGVSIWIRDLSAFQLRNLVMIASEGAGLRMDRLFRVQSLGIAQSSEGALVDAIAESTIPIDEVRDVIHRLASTCADLAHADEKESCLDGSSFDIWLAGESSSELFLSFSASNNPATSAAASDIRQLCARRL